jgi:formamidopyrimidine-DNA glycosylase
MPELPDLQVFSKNLNKELSGKTLKKLSIVNKRKLRTPETKLKKALEKQKITKIERLGKELHFHFRNGNVLGLHLMLHGNLNIFEKKNEKKYSIIELLFNDGTGLALTDFQGMATPTLNPAEKDAPDALSREVNYKYLKQKFSSTKATIKAVLMDQDVIRGIGNAYADEILWDAAINPFSVASALPDEKIRQLARSIKSVLKNAEKQIKKKNPDLITGEIRDFLLIHNSRRKESPNGKEILQKPMAGRKTYYTEEQELYK